jgi:hypothetical protein
VQSDATVWFAVLAIVDVATGPIGGLDPCPAEAEVVGHELLTTMLLVISDDQHP